MGLSLSDDTSIFSGSNKVIKKWKIWKSSEYYKTVMLDLSKFEVWSCIKMEVYYTSAIFLNLILYVYNFQVSIAVDH